MIRIAVMSMIAALSLASMTGCKIGRDKSDDPPQNGAVLDSGESLGEIERLPGGTPVATDVRTLLTAQCTDGVLTLRTSQEQITAGMDCGQMLPEPVVVRFIGQPVVIRAEEGRLIVENEVAGTMNFPAPDPRIEEVGADAP